EGVDHEHPAEGRADRPAGERQERHERPGDPEQRHRHDEALAVLREHKVDDEHRAERAGEDELGGDRGVVDLHVRPQPPTSRVSPMTEWVVTSKIRRGYRPRPRVSRSSGAQATISIGWTSTSFLPSHWAGTLPRFTRWSIQRK